MDPVRGCPTERARVKETMSTLSPPPAPTVPVVTAPHSTTASSLFLRRGRNSLRWCGADTKRWYVPAGLKNMRHVKNRAVEGTKINRNITYRNRKMPCVLYDISYSAFNFVCSAI